MSVNAAEIAFWNSEATRWWAERHDPIDQTFADVTRAVLDRIAPRPGERVLDIGCATGTTLLALAERVAPAPALGVDISERSIARAEARIAASGLTNVRAILADASTHDFEPGGFDLIFSRFGIMFFVDPVATFAHLRRALAAKGRFAAMAFRSPAENPWATGIAQALRDVLPPTPPPPPEATGQFSWADPARIHRILGGGGFRDISLTRLDPSFRVAAPGEIEAAAERAFTVGPLARATRDMTEADRASLKPRVEKYFREHEGPDGVVMPAAIWLIEARP